MLSDYVVMGKAESVEKHGVVNDNHLKYVFKVEQFFKGYEYSDRIDVYTLNDEIEVGSEYVLFLDYWENEFTPNPIHALIYHDTNIKLNYNTLVGNEKYINDMNKEQLIDYISRSPLLKQTTKREFSIRNKANDLLFLKRRNSTAEIATRSGSIIEKKDKIHWNEIMSKLNEVSIDI